MLLCDDHLLFAEALGDVLVARGDEVDLTATPAQAVACALGNKPDICVMDHTFPTGNLGIDGVRQVLRVSPRTAVMMLSGTADAAVARAAIGAGVRGFLRKDEPLTQLVEALDQLGSGLLVVDANILRPDLRAAPSSVLDRLTVREREVLERLVHGESGSEMAREMRVSYSTMRTHVQNVLVKLGVHSQLEAAAYAVQHGLVQSRAG